MNELCSSEDWTKRKQTHFPPIPSFFVSNPCSDDRKRGVKNKTQGKTIIQATLLLSSLARPVFISPIPDSAHLEFAMIVPRTPMLPSSQGLGFSPQLSFVAESPSLPFITTSVAQSLFFGQSPFTTPRVDAFTIPSSPNVPLVPRMASTGFPLDARIGRARLLLPDLANGALVSTDRSHQHVLGTPFRSPAGLVPATPVVQTADGKYPYQLHCGAVALLFSNSSSTNHA